MVITWQTVITAGAVVTAILLIGGIVLSIHKWYLKQEEQSEEIKELKRENGLICFALSACLDGLQQLGANHTVPVAKDKLDKYLNQQAHK